MKTNFLKLVAAIPAVIVATILVAVLWDWLATMYWLKEEFVWQRSVVNSAVFSICLSGVFVGINTIMAKKEARTEAKKNKQTPDPPKP